MGDGWLMNPKDRWTYRFHKDENAWVREPKVFVDMGRPMPGGSFCSFSSEILVLVARSA